MYANIDILADTEMRKAGHDSVMTVHYDSDSEGKFAIVTIVRKDGKTKEFVWNKDSRDWVLAGTWFPPYTNRNKLIREMVREAVGT
jgi:hypothetical protein